MPGTKRWCLAPDRGRLHAVNLLRLLDEIDVVHVSGDPDVEVSSVEHDSRRVGPGSLFCCLPGQHSDGHDFAAQAVEHGAVGLVCEHAVEAPPDAQVVQVRVAPGFARPAMAHLAAALYGHPSRQLLIAGITGTNGKTTVAHLVGEVLKHAGIPTLVIGTLTGTRTTPEATELQAMLAAERDQAAEDHLTHAVAMEVSSHALAQQRVEAITFDVAVFTNLSHDHLDFHKTMEAYWEAKASLFSPERAARGIVFAGDEAGERLVAEARIPIRAVRRDDVAGVELGLGWSRFLWQGRPVQIPLTGRFNVDNAVLAAETALDPRGRARRRRRAGSSPRRRCRGAWSPSWSRGTSRRSRSWSTTPTRPPASRSCSARSSACGGPRRGRSSCSGAGGTATPPSAP